MRIAHVMTQPPGAVDRTLVRFAERLESAGVRTCGTVQINGKTPPGRRCDMDLRILHDGPLIRISQSLGKHARGCRLDTAALEEAVAQTTVRFERGADVMIVNKFGKHEADGRGFRDLIAEALARDVPVVVGLNALNKDAFFAFTEGLSEPVPADCDVLLHWLRCPVTA